MEGSTYGGGGGMVSDARPSPAREAGLVHIHMEHMIRCSERLDKLLATLEDRLKPVLSPDDRAEKRGLDVEPRPAQSGIAHALNDHGEKLSYFCIRTQEMLDRLEV